MGSRFPNTNNNIFQNAGQRWKWIVEWTKYSHPFLLLHQRLSHLKALSCPTAPQAPEYFPIPGKKYSVRLFLSDKDDEKTMNCRKQHELSS